MWQVGLKVPGSDVPSTWWGNLSTGYPRHGENRGDGITNSLSGKTQGVWKVCQNTGETQGSLLKHREFGLLEL